jgi:ABC-type transport system involved in multi-copper enzyme maturation permease subunit
LREVLVIARKEIRDSASNKVFLLCACILMFSMILAGASASDAYMVRITDPQFQHIENRQEIFKNIVMENIVPQIRTIGVLVAVVLGVESIYKEREEGSLRILLSYPVYRDQVIFGKLSGRLFTLGIVAAASMTIAFSIFFYSTLIVLTIDLLIRMLVSILLTFLFLAFYLCLGIAVSIVVHDLKIGLLIVFITVGIINYGVLTYFVGILLPELLFGSGFRLIRFQHGMEVVPLNPMVNVFQELSLWIFPSQIYTNISINILSSIKLVGINGVFSGIPVTIINILSNECLHFITLIIYLSIIIIICYVLFVRGDI